MNGGSHAAADERVNNPCPSSHRGFRGLMTTYTRKWFDQQVVGAASSASTVVPLVMDLVHPRSVVDVGCGMGVWLAEFIRAGVQDVLGLDGDYIDRGHLAIPTDKFRVCDLRQPLPADRKFDLAVSLEVAEHLPPGVAEQFVAGLAALAPVVLFSAAIPAQPGNQHINTQWQSYWAGLFAARGYAALDPIRPAVWNDPRVEWWYSQNTLMYVSRERLASDERLSRLVVPAGSGMLDAVHPALHEATSARAARPGKYFVRQQVTLVKKAIRSLVPGGGGGGGGGP